VSSSHGFTVELSTSDGGEGDHNDYSLYNSKPICLPPTIGFLQERGTTSRSLFYLNRLLVLLGSTGDRRSSKRAAGPLSRVAPVLLDGTLVLNFQSLKRLGSNHTGAARVNLRALPPDKSTRIEPSLKNSHLGNNLRN